MKYKHALFLNPYIESGATTAMSLFPPTGLEYVATSAKDHVGKLTLLDLRCEKELCDIGKLKEFISREGVDIMCASISWNRDFPKIIELLKALPGGMPLVIGGYKATEDAEEIFKICPRVDIIVRGEGEETIKEILKDSPLEDMLGISYRKNGEVCHNKNRPLPDINTIVPPDRGLRQNVYTMTSLGVRVTTATFDTILSSRGCPFSCKFCTFNLNPLGQKREYASRTPESVIKEIEGISAGIILFSDDNFFAEPKRAEKICDLIISRGIKKRFSAQARIDLARYPALLAKIVKAGFKMLLLGIESPHDRILKAMNKGYDQATIRKYFEVFRKYPILYHGNYIYGNLTETTEEMLYLAQFSKEIGVDSVAFSRLRVDKYSPLKEIVENTPGYYLSERGEVLSNVYDKAGLKEMHRKLKFTFYTPWKILKIGAKFVYVGFFNFRELMSFVLAAPMLVHGLLAKEIRRKRLGDSVRRILKINA